MEWKEVTLGDFMQCNPKRTIKKGQKARKITMDLLIPHSKTIRNWNYEPYSGGAKFQNGDTIMARITPCLENGKHAFVSILDKGEIAYGSTEYFVFCGKEDVSDNDFVYYLTKTPLFRDTAIKSMVGSSGRQRAQMDVLENLKMLVPKDISVQRRIASILSSLDRKMELNNKINADLEEMAQAIFKNWFVDFEPFKDGKFVNSELGMIPEGWKVGSPYEYVKVVYGAPYKSAKFNDDGEGLPLIRIRDLKDCKPQFYTPEILPQTEYVNMGDIVAGMDAEFVPHIWKGKMGLLNQRVCKLIPQQTSISNLFVLYLMKPELEFVQSYKTGTTVSHLGKADIDKFVVVLPPLEVVEECSKILDSILQRIRNISAESRNLSLLRDTLLPRLMSGEIEVPE